MEFLTSDEAERYCSEKLQLDICEEELTEIISIIELYDIENFKTEAYRKLGDKYYYNNKYGDAIEYYTKALDFCEKIGDNNSSICILYNLIGACKYAELMYEEALVYFDKANIFAIIFGDITTEVNSLFNSAMCYYKLSWIDKAIEYADYCIDKLNGNVKSDKYIYAHIIKINCYSAKNDYLMAIEVSRNLIESMEEKESIVAANLYNNLGIFLLELNRQNEALQYFNKSEEIRREKDIYNLSHTLIHKAEVYKRNEMYSEAEILLMEGIDIAIQNNDHEYALKGKQALLQLYEDTSRTKKIEELYISIIKLLKNKNHQELKKAYLQLAEFYIKQGKLDKATVYMELSHNI